MKIGERLRLFREKCGFTQQQIANALCIDRSTYSYYETGKTNPDLSTLLHLADIFHVDVRLLLEPFAPQTEEPSHTGLKINQTDIFELSKGERQIVCYFRKIGTPEKEKLLEFAASLAAEPLPKGKGRGRKKKSQPQT